MAFSPWLGPLRPAWEVGMTTNKCMPPLSCLCPICRRCCCRCCPLLHRHVMSCHSLDDPIRPRRGWYVSILWMRYWERHIAWAMPSSQPSLCGDTALLSLWVPRGTHSDNSAVSPHSDGCDDGIAHAMCRSQYRIHNIDTYHPRRGRIGSSRE